MWQKLSLRARLNCLLALILALGLAANIARLVLDAGPRVLAEDRSVVRLAKEFLETLVGSLGDAADPDARLDAIVADLNKLRHVSITREQANGAPPNLLPPTPPPTGMDEATSPPPGWFVSLVHPEQISTSVPVVVGGRSLGSLVIASHPIDEIAEIWEGIVTQIEIGTAIAAILLAITMAVVGRALAPIGALSEAMTRIEGGDYATRVAPSGSPELAAICARLNHLAATLGSAIEDKRRLAERVVSLQDVERKEIARELHDEFGPYLFALRAHASSLLKLADMPAPDMAALRPHAKAMLDQVNALQQFNRRVLDRLRPVGLAELGLREALNALTRLWREAHPNVVVATHVAPSLGARGETAELTIYRVVQEALTNVFRHAGATRVDVSIEPADPAQRDAARVRVSDNGGGLPADHRHGLGLTGMRERVMALGGTMTMNSTEHGVTIEAIVPGQMTA